MGKLTLAAALALCALSVEAATYRATLAGANETPNPGDPDGAGVAFVTIDGAEVHYYIRVEGIEAPTAAHIHVGEPTVGGSVVVNFAPAFASPASGVWVASGSVTSEAAVTEAIEADPGGYYVNVHNATFAGGAVRGQLLGSGAAVTGLAATLIGAREVGAAGDPDGSAFAGLVVDGDTLYYYIRVEDIAAPTSAHIHRGRAGEQGPAVVGFVVEPVLVNGVIVGSIATSPELAAELLRDPAGFYVNVHNGDFPGGAVRGQLGRTETALHFPVVARNKGAGTSLFKTDIRIMSFSDRDEVVWAEWYPKNTAGLAGPAMTVEVVVAAGGEAVLDDAPGLLFGATDRGAIRLVSHAAFVAVGRTYNDQRTSGSGTFGQFTEGLDLGRAATSGGLLLGANRPKADLVDFRTNLGYFNPNPTPVDVVFTVKKPDGTPVGTLTARTFPAFANDLLLYYQIVTGVPAAERNQANFLITYTASAPVFIYSSVVDNVTDDGLHQPALPVPPPAPTPTPNQPPDAVITSPAGNVTITQGDTVTFDGTTSDPDGDAVTVQWDFGDGVSSGLLSTTHTYLVAGVYTVTLTATDALDNVDPTPASVQVTVNAPPPAVTLAELQEEIFTPICSGCHPPNGGMDLREGHTFASIVNVNSSQQPALKRVAPGDPDNSYLVRKLEGADGITGSQMPQGGPFLHPSQIQRVRDWITAGAQNN